MPFPAMKQTNTVTRSGEDVGGWGDDLARESIEFKCRVDEKTQTVQNQYGDEVISSAEILLWKHADIRYDDKIKFRNELGIEFERQPVRIEPLRWFDGKPRYTLVFV